MGPRTFYALLFAVLLYVAPIVHSMALPGVPIETLFTDLPPPQDENESLPKPQANRVEEGDYFEGDIRLRPGEDPYNIFHRWMLPRTARSIPQTSEVEFMSSRLWPGRRIPYKFHRELGPGNTRLTFMGAMRVWEDKTCIRFVGANDNDTDYLLLTDQNGYSSFVGRDRGEQEVSIKPVEEENDKKALGHAMHELGHAIGMWHEHSRRDRNEYVQINYENIRENKQINFGLLSEIEFSQVPNVGYDFESIMHYGPYAFSSKRGKNPTIQIQSHIFIPKCAKKMGQRDELSYKDILRANRLYSCFDKLNQMPPNDCPILSDPTPPVIEPTTSSTTPTPSATPTPTVPPVTCEVDPMATNDRIPTGAVITLNFCGDNSQAIECTIERDCHRETCGSFFGCSTQQQFEIYFTEIQRKNQFLKNGDTVVIRSRDKRHLWLDCTRGYCTITHDCSNNEEGYYNASNVSECNNHTFKVYSKHRDRDNRSALRTNEPLVFQHEENDTYLNCQDKKCKMVPEEGLCGNDPLQESADPARCLLPQLFRIDLPDS